ncbi:MAG: dTMP kinase [Nitrospirae bacterium]|nr:dTMP kinase [Candidatus Manganitrophaceae bacterium]
MYDKPFAGGVVTGHFITFEGVEGSGKTTQLAILADDLETRGLSVVRTREPGGTKIGDAIRALILDSKNQTMDAKAELLLYLASRAQHLKEVILPALETGKVVLCDRFADATYAYQGVGRGLSKRGIEQIGRFVTEGRQPDLTLLLDIDPKKGLARLKGREEINRLDREALQFHEAVRKGYLHLAKRNPRRIQVVSTDGAVDEIAQKIRKVVDDYFRNA